MSHARRLADAYGPLAGITHAVAAATDLTALVTAASGPVLLPVTDRLFGATPEAAAQAVEQAAGAARLVLALHDIPQPQEGDDWFRRRRDAYRRFVAAASRVIVASHTERRALVALVDDRPGLERRVRVVPLPVERGAGQPMPRAPREVSTFGFLYPGKGVEDLVDAVVATPSAPRVVVNYGAAAPGHEDQVETLIRYAAERDVELRVTGYVPDAELGPVLRRAGVPVAPHRHVSASGSVGCWVAAGRRPVVRDLGWFHELDARLPGAVTVATSLPVALAAAVADPTSTWLADDVEVGPSWTAAAQAHVAVLEELS